MTNRIKDTVKQFLPPIVLNICKKIRLRKDPNLNIFCGNYNCWNDALKISKGYDSRLIFEKVKAAALAVKNGEAIFERDSVIFYHEEYNWPLLAILLKIGSENKNKLSVLDFGGSLGSTYFQHRKMLEHIDLNWNIVEQPHFVEFGKQALEDNIIHFHFSLKEAASQSKPDLILLSSVLPYLKSPWKELDKIINFRSTYILLDRTPVLENSVENRLTVQKVPVNIYDASYPAWFFSESELLRYFKENNYEQTLSFEALTKVFTLQEPYAIAFDRGYLFKDKSK